MRASECVSVKECAKRKTRMKLTTSTRGGGRYFGRIYSAEYFAVLREWRIRPGVARWCRDAFLNIRSIFVAFQVIDTRRVATCVRMFYGFYPKSDMRRPFFVKRLKSSKVAIRQVRTTLVNLICVKKNGYFTRFYKTRY